MNNSDEKENRISPTENRFPNCFLKKGIKPIVKRWIRNINPKRKRKVPSTDMMFNNVFIKVAPPLVLLLRNVVFSHYTSNYFFSVESFYCFVGSICCTEELPLSLIAFKTAVSSSGVFTSSLFIYAFNTVSS
jgi:hypothetical protein